MYNGASIRPVIIGDVPSWMTLKAHSQDATATSTAIDMGDRLHYTLWRYPQLCPYRTVWMTLYSESPFDTGVIVTEKWSEINGHQIQATIFDLFQATNSSKGIYALYPRSYINLDGLYPQSKLILILELMGFWWWYIASKYQKLLLLCSKETTSFTKEPTPISCLINPCWK